MRQTFWQMVNQSVRQVPVYVEMYNKKLVRAYRPSFDVGVDVIASWGGASPDVQKVMNATDLTCVASKIESYLMVQAVGGGPKIFKPTSEQLFALERMKLNIQVSEFAMPFDTIIVELPDEYRKSRLEKASVAILHRDPATQFFVHCLIFDDNTAYKSWWPAKPTQDVEEWFVDGLKTDFGDLEVEPPEEQCELFVKRAVLNYCLLLDEVGTKCDGPQVPNQYNQLVKWCAKKNEHTAKNKAALQAQPKLYSLNKPPIDLVRVVKSSKDLPEGESDWMVSPHFRRGHYRMQPHGPQGSLRKRIRIPSTIVNKEWFFGGSTTYRT